MKFHGRLLNNGVAYKLWLVGRDIDVYEGRREKLAYQLFDLDLYAIPAIQFHTLERYFDAWNHFGDVLS